MLVTGSFAVATTERFSLLLWPSFASTRPAATPTSASAPGVAAASAYASRGIGEAVSDGGGGVDAEDHDVISNGSRGSVVDLDEEDEDVDAENPDGIGYDEEMAEEVEEKG